MGNTLVENLGEHGVDTRFVRRVDGVSTGIAIIIVSGGNNRIILDKGANACLSENDIDRVLENAEEGDIYLTQLENSIDVIGYGLRRAKEKGLYTILNPAPANCEIIPYLSWVDSICGVYSQRCTTVYSLCKGITEIQ